MDIQVSSNFERLLFDLVDQDPTAVRSMMDDLAQNGGFKLSQGMRDRLALDFISDCASEDETKAQIRDARTAYGETVCPHTAVGLKAAGKIGTPHGVPLVTLATAHPAKFPAAVEAACGINPPLPPHMSGLEKLPERMTKLPDDLGAIQNYIKEHIGT